LRVFLQQLVEVRLDLGVFLELKIKFAESLQGFETPGWKITQEWVSHTSKYRIGGSEYAAGTAQRAKRRSLEKNEIVSPSRQTRGNGWQSDEIHLVDG
jgi:hypothetical protein